MVEEFVTWDQIQPIIYLVVIISGFLVFIKWRWSYVMMQQKQAASKIRKDKSIDNLIDNKLNEFPGQLKKVQDELRHLQNTNANAEQMKSLRDKERMLQLAIEYGDVAAEIGKPIINKVLKFVKGIG